MRQKTIDGILVTKPTREDVENLKVGDLAPDCFGKMRRVTEIFARREDINGKLFVCFYTEFGERSTMSGSMKEDEIVATTEISSKFKRTSNIQF